MSNKPQVYFPTDLSHLIVLETLKGSTNPEKVQDTTTLQTFVKKRGANAQHCMNEYNANQIYFRLSAPVPPMYIFLVTE